jgi:hypothetical protein
MRRPAREFLPQARTENMVIKEVDDEVLVYDLERDKAHCLNSLAATLWCMCDGKTTTTGLANSLQHDGTNVDEELIWLGLRDLRRNHLLEDAGSWPDQMAASKDIRMSRREAVRRIGLGATIALPLVISIAAPTPVQAAVSCGAKCKPCSTGADCCSGVCVMSPSGCASGTRRCA